MNKTSDRSYIAIDLKSFYASVECVERGLDPLRTNLVVADPGRTTKTICLAVSPSLKAYGIAGRARLFEVVKRVKEVNNDRIKKAPVSEFTGASCDAEELKENPSWKLDYIVAPPRMAYYMQYSTDIYNIYLKYVAAEDIHVYSIDEVFMDVTDYLNTYRMTAHELAMTMIRDVLRHTGITATAGIGTNMYLCKIAMDIVAKKMPADEDGVRIAELNEYTYRELLWDHQPLTDFWRIGNGYSRKLAENGLYTMGDIARCSIGRPGEFYNEDLLYRLFGINAELLIDHAWGWEPVTIKEIKAYRPQNNSICSGQVLKRPYDYPQARMVLKEMAELLSLDLVRKGLVTDQIVLTVGYDINNLTNEERRKKYHGPVVTDRYGRAVPKHAHGTGNIERYTASTRMIMETTVKLFDEIVNRDLQVRRFSITANHVIREKDIPKKESYEQLSFFSDFDQEQIKREKLEKNLEKEKKMQQAVLKIKDKYGKNAIIKGTNLQEGATTIERNQTIGGHKA